ncbi:hypothetical protein A6M21_15280 [Desulfotomaculum copahuensis]|uniref:Uncharacterized protein n=1 Tax=Desulfotomaculum copahuensis TaxID=1838280 RepID=A0A1B7LBG7_9FIRM|nr:hypothetical protein A6M21_15280 [Desulfotomaculum copahuensis]
MVLIIERVNEQNIDFNKWFPRPGNHFMFARYQCRVASFRRMVISLMLKQCQRKNRKKQVDMTE